MQARRRALRQILWGLQLHWLNGGWIFACYGSVNRALNWIPTYYNMSYIKHTCRRALHLWKLNLNVIPNAGRCSCSMGFLVVSIQPATVYSRPNVNARGPLSFTRLCWSHTAFPCIIYIELSPLLCIHKHRSQTSWDQWMTEIKYLCQPWNTSDRSHDRRALQRQLPAECPPEGSTISSVRESRERGLCLLKKRTVGNGWALSIYSCVPAVLIHDLLFCLCTEKYQILILLYTKLTRHSL